MKKILTLVLALCMLSSYAFAEDLIENIDLEPGFPVVKEPVSVTIALVPQGSAVDFQVEQNWMTEYINRNSGLDIEWMVIDSTAASERIPLMLNSGDMPDAILGHAFQANDIAQYGTSEGMFYPVNELLDYMPILLRVPGGKSRGSRRHHHDGWQHLRLPGPQQHLFLCGAVLY